MSSETERLAGAGEVVVAKDQAWTLSLVTPKIRAAFALSVKADARNEIESLRALVGRDAYQRDLQAFHSACAAGDYSWGSPFDPRGMGPAVSAAVNGADGRLRLVQLLLAKQHGEVPPQTVAELFDSDVEGFVEALRACLELPKLPNEGAPADAGGKAATAA